MTAHETEAHLLGSLQGAARVAIINMDAVMPLLPGPDAAGLRATRTQLALALSACDARSVSGEVQHEH